MMPWRARLVSISTTWARQAAALPPRRLHRWVGRGHGRGGAGDEGAAPVEFFEDGPVALGVGRVLSHPLAPFLVGGVLGPAVEGGECRAGGLWSLVVTGDGCL
ncbi:MAG: hypothetical protein M3381_05125 [Actinomycetota bacterium]|nr:hypothetical protein [Actinomycetota bacterium]